MSQYSEAVGILRAEGTPAHFHELCQSTKEQCLVPLTSDFYNFLGIKRPDVPWGRLHALPTHEVPGLHMKYISCNLLSVKFSQRIVSFF